MYAIRSYYDLQLVEATPDEIKLLDNIAEGKTGTVILWESVDRLLKKIYDDPAGRHARNALKGYVEKLRFHVAMVYQRFLDENDKRAQNVSIRINGEQVLPWDPFCVSETKAPIAENRITSYNVCYTKLLRFFQ